MIIQVVGSKPGAKILNDADLTVFVNGSAHIVHEIDEERHVLITGQNLLGVKSKTQQYVFDSLKGKKFRDVYLIDFQNEGLNNSLERKLPFHYTNISYLSRIQKNKEELKFISFKTYLQKIFKVKGPSISEKLKFFRYVISKKEIKLSTGLYAVLRFLIEYESCQVVISGIGFGESQYWYGKENKLRYQFINDYAFLLSLEKESIFWKRVSTTEDQLIELFGITRYMEKG